MTLPGPNPAPGQPDEIEVAKLLLQLQDLKNIGDVALLDLVRDARVEQLAKGQLLHADHHKDRHVYLIEGEVELIANNTHMAVVTAHTDRAQLPLFRIRPPGLVARCKQASRLLSLNEKTFEKYVATIQPDDHGGITVEELSPVQDEQSIIIEIRNVFNHKEVDLPSLPDVAQRIHLAVENEALDIQKIANIVQSDPVISARILQVANSAMYGKQIQVDTIKKAITRIGLKATRAIVISVVLKNLYQPQSEIIHKRMRAFYQHSIRVGAICHALAKQLRGFDPDQAFLAGLIHDIGTIPILIQADKRASLNTSMELLETAINELSKTVGPQLLSQWGFDEQLITVARESDDWQRKTSKADYCDLVQIAQLNCVHIGGTAPKAPPMHDIGAFKRLSMEKIDPVAVIKQARQEILEIVELL